MNTMRTLIAVLAMVTLASKSGSTQDAKPKDPPESIVQEQVEAYNKHDIDAFLKYYSPDIKLYGFPDKMIYSGLPAMRETYGKLFADTPELNVEIAKRIVQGDTIIDQERVNAKGRKFTVTTIYHVKDGKIVAVWFIR